MVKCSSFDVDNIFVALSHEIRRNILKRLLEKPATVSELAAPFSISLPAITKHLDILERSRLINRERNGRTYIVSINSQPLLEVKKWLSIYESFWIRQLESITTYLSTKK